MKSNSIVTYISLSPHSMFITYGTIYLFYCHCTLVLNAFCTHGSRMICKRYFYQHTCILFLIFHSTFCRNEESIFSCRILSHEMRLKTLRVGAETNATAHRICPPSKLNSKIFIEICKNMPKWQVLTCRFRIS